MFDSQRQEGAPGGGVRPGGERGGAGQGRLPAGQGPTGGAAQRPARRQQL